MTTLPAMVRCPKCKTAWREDSAFETVHYGGSPAMGGLPATPPREEHRPLVARCPTCRGFLDIRQITGVEDATVPCGARCQEAVGPDCRCSCGNRNHGIAHVGALREAQA